jgi:bacteriorhodopsin
MDQPDILSFFETVIFSILTLAWASWEYFSVSRLQKKQKEEAAAKAAAESENAGQKS